MSPIADPSAAIPTASAVDSRRVVKAAPWVAALLVAVWFLIGVSNGTSQWGDHFEQFVWAHSVEWGYHKHPPLPTWMLATVIAVFGPAVASAQALAVVCTLGTGFFTYRSRAICSAPRPRHWRSSCGACSNRSRVDPTCSITTAS